MRSFKSKNVIQFCILANYSILILLIICAIIATMRKKYFTIFLSILIFSVFSGCKLGLIAKTSESLEIVVKGESFTLAWDPGGPEIPNDPNFVVRYNIYYRNHGSYYWRFLMKIESSGNPECLITDKEIDYGRYDFAVSAINEQGETSALHSSLDSSANPFSGWYINWLGSK